jgi:hypothetical protein
VKEVTKVMKCDFVLARNFSCLSVLYHGNEQVFSEAGH